MNKTCFTTLIALITASSAAFAEGDFIREIHQEDGIDIVHDVAVNDDEGAITSEPLETDLSTFILYTTVETTENGRTTSSLKELDRESVGTFVPTGTITFESEDPHSPPRTRADQPYGVKLTIAGLQSSAEAPTYAKQVEVSRSYRLYDADTYAPSTDEADQGEYADTFEFKHNGIYHDEAISQRLPGDSPTLATGEETVTIRLDPSAPVQSSKIESGTIQIWPVASAGIIGLEEGKKYAKIPNDATLVLDKIYPESITYAQIYKGSRAFGTVGTPVPSSVISYGGTDAEPTMVPQKALLSLSDLSTFFDKDGTYTMEILTITPFNNGEPELLADISFEYDRVITFRGGMTNME